MLVLCAELCVYRRQSRLFPSELLVKVRGIRRVSDGREVWWWDTLVIDIVKVDILEEQVSFDILSVCFSGTESSSWISGEELDTGQHWNDRPSRMPTHSLQKRDRVSWHGDRVQWFIFQNGIEDFVLVVTPEGRLSE